MIPDNIVDLNAELRSAKNQLKLAGETIRFQQSRLKEAHSLLIIKNKRISKAEAENKELRKENEKLLYDGVKFILIKKPGMVWRVKRPGNTDDLEMLKECRELYPDAEIILTTFRGGKPPELWVNGADQYIEMMEADWGEGVENGG